MDGSATTRRSAHRHAHEGASTLVTRHARSPPGSGSQRRSRPIVEGCSRTGYVAVHDPPSSSRRRPDRRDLDRSRHSRTRGRSRFASCVRPKRSGRSDRGRLRSGARLANTNERDSVAEDLRDGSLFSRTAFLLEPWEPDDETRRASDRSARATDGRPATEMASWLAGPRQRESRPRSTDRRRDCSGGARRPGAGRGHDDGAEPDTSNSSSSTHRIGSGSMSSASSPRSQPIHLARDPPLGTGRSGDGRKESDTHGEPSRGAAGCSPLAPMRRTRSVRPVAWAGDRGDASDPSGARRCSSGAHEA